jgi:hypothetical protein
MRRPKPRFAVFDPTLDCNRATVAALGTDAVRLEPGPVDWRGGHPLFRVDFGSIAPARQRDVCRMLADRNGVSLAWAFVTAVQCHAVVICGHCCYVCHDPAEGRAHYAKEGAR